MAEHTRDDHGGSSIANVTATNSLRNKLSNIWKQLKSKSYDLASGLDCIHPLKGMPISMPREAELFLLICSLFSDYFRIPIDELVIFGMGLELFEDVHGNLAARRRVHDVISIINDIKYSRKAIGPKIRLAHEEDGTNNQYLEMLDGARDLTTLFVSKYPLVFHRETVTGKWPPSADWCKDWHGLSLVFKEVNKNPIGWDLPKLTLLHLQYKEDSQSIGVDIFEGMKELRVLSLDVPSVPHSLNVLRNLTTLNLKVPKSEDMSWIGCLKNLKFLSISILDLTDIPMEMAKLQNLVLLDLRKTNIVYIPPGVLSSLLKLEELYLPFSFDRWGCKARKYDEYVEWGLGEGAIFNDDICERDDEVRINASLTEIVSHSLNALQICVPKASILPKMSHVLKNIREFKILIPDNVKYKPFGKPSINELQLTGEACDIKESGICNLMGRTEDLCLTRVRNLKNLIEQLQDTGFPQLKKMIITECDELECVVDATRTQILSDGNSLFQKLECLHLSVLSNLKEICHGRLGNFPCFQNLSQISIRFCPKLKYMLPLSIVGGLNLKSIEILDCHELEGIFYEDEEDIPFTLLCSIEKLDLHSLPRVVSLLAREDDMIDGVRGDINKSLTTNKVVSNYQGSISTFLGDSESSSTNESLSLVNESCIDEEIICDAPNSTSRAELEKGVAQQLDYCKQASVINDAVSHMKTYDAFTSKLAKKWFQNLRILRIAFCDVKVVFLFDDNNVTSKPFPSFNSLEVLELHGLQNLVHIWFKTPLRVNDFMNLQLLLLSRCSCLYLFPSRVATFLFQLQKVYISHCDYMEEILVKDDDRNKKIVFPRLKLMELQHMRNLRYFSLGVDEIELPLLESVKLNQCNTMESFSYGLLRTPMLEHVEVDGSLCPVTEGLNAIITGGINPSSFTLVDLKTATHNFSSNYLLGKGDFGEVYKGVIKKKDFCTLRKQHRNVSCHQECNLWV